MTTPSIVLWDVMGTLVHDPFYVEVPAFFGTSLDALLKVKHPTAWVECETGTMSVEAMETNFFADGRAYDVEGLRSTMRDAYELLAGIESLLDDLRGASVPMHVVSNYTGWYAMIEDKLRLSAWMTWSFVSCDIGVRKPDPRYYAVVLERLGAAASDCVFIDDRASNCEGAKAAGMHAIQFDDAVRVRTALAQLGVAGLRP
ncbi:MAG: HAD family phosphatase [Myxococcota bacterium]